MKCFREIDWKFVIPAVITWVTVLGGLLSVGNALSSIMEDERKRKAEHQKLSRPEPHTVVTTHR